MATNESSKKETLPELVKKMAQNVSCLYCWQSKPSKSSSEELESLPPSNRSATHNPFPEFSAPAQYGSESDEKSQRVNCSCFCINIRLCEIHCFCQNCPLSELYVITHNVYLCIQY